MRDDEKDSGKSVYTLRAVDRVCDVLDILANSQEPVTLTTVAEVSNLPKSSAFRYLAVLEERGYVSRDEPTGLYELGPAFRPQHTRAMEDLTRVGLPLIQSLRDRFMETTNIAILDGTSILYVAVAESPHRMRVASRIGDRGAIHSTALGKAICSQLPESRVLAILDASGMPASTPRTITERGQYLEELREVKSKGYAVDDTEDQRGSRCVAVVISGLEVPAGLSVSAPSNRLAVDSVEDVARDLRKAAKDIEKALR
jgi:IclR family acetate operon transcriptional repressor